MTKIERLKRRADFLAVAGQRRKYVAPGLILQACRRAGGGARVLARGLHRQPQGGHRGRA